MNNKSAIQLVKAIIKKTREDYIKAVFSSQTEEDLKKRHQAKVEASNISEEILSHHFDLLTLGNAKKFMNELREITDIDYVNAYYKLVPIDEDEKPIEGTLEEVLPRLHKNRTRAISKLSRCIATGTIYNVEITNNKKRFKEGKLCIVH